MRNINSILNSGLHPKQAALLKGLFGILAVIAFSVGAKAGFIAGALFFWFFYILDSSGAGILTAKLDTLVNCSVHIAALGAITFGLYAASRSLPALIFGVVAITGICLSFFVVALQKIRNAPNKISALDKLIEMFTAGDFSVIFLVFALFDRMELLLLLTALAANAFCVIFLIANFRSLAGPVFLGERAGQNETACGG